MAEEKQPLLRVVRGNPTEEELAALVRVVVAAAAQTSPSQPTPQQSAWARVGRFRPALPPYRGPAAWRAAVQHR